MIKPTNQVHYIEQKLRKLILDMGLKPGEKVTERDIESKFHISRTSVRNAFFNLENEGLMLHKKRSWFISPIDLIEIKQLCRYRNILETSSIKEFKGNRRKITEGKKLLTSMTENLSHEEFYQIGYKFHSWIGELSDNIFILKSIQNATLRLRRARWLAGEHNYKNWQQQFNIIQALEENKINEAVQMTTNLLYEKEENLIKILKEKYQFIKEQKSLFLSIKNV